MKEVRVGYAGGHSENPTYKQVCAGKTGHAEAFEVTFDPAEISYAELLERLFTSHTPPAQPRPSWQYRSAIFFHTSEQEREAREAVEARKKAGLPAGVEVLPAPVFWEAEAYHQRYYEKQGRR